MSTVLRNSFIAIIVMAVLIGAARFHISTAQAPCLAVAGDAFVPEALMPPALGPREPWDTATIRIEGLDFRHIELSPVDEHRDIRPGKRLKLETAGEHVDLLALDCLRFWDSPMLREVSDYSPIVAVARCVRVVDGDTILLSNGERLRYIGIDTPETKHPSKPVEAYGIEAAERNRQLVEGKRLYLEYDAQAKDRYGRTLAYVHANGVFVNAQLVAEGYAHAVTYPPNVRYEELFRYLERSARSASRGLWGDPDPAMPISNAVAR